MDADNDHPSATPTTSGNIMTTMPGSFGGIPEETRVISEPAVMNTGASTGLGGQDASHPLDDYGQTRSSAFASSTSIGAGPSNAVVNDGDNVLRNRFTTAARGNRDSESDNSDELEPQAGGSSSRSSSWSSLSRTPSPEDTASSSSSSDASDAGSNPNGDLPNDDIDIPHIAPEPAPAPEPVEPREATPPPPYVPAAEPQPVAAAAAPGPIPEADEPQCRICLGGQEDCDELGPLIRPCRCIGTISFVHVQCLNSWRTRSASRSAFWECPQCHFKYAFVRTRVFGLAESKLALGSMTLVLFILLVFIASALVSTFFPDILYPELAAERLARRIQEDPLRGYSSFGFGFGFGGWNFMTYDLTALPEIMGDFIRLAAATFLDVDIDVGKLLRAFSSSASSSKRSTKPRRPGAAAGSGSGARYATGRGPAATRGSLRTDSQGNVLADRINGRGKSFIGRIVARFMLGLSTLGIVSFLQLAMSMSLLAPLQIARGTWFRRRRRDGGGGGMEGAAAIMIAVFVLIGVVRAMQQVYRMTVWLAKILLTRAETAILDVDGNPHYARPAQPPAAAAPGDEVPVENLNLREQATRWLAERAVVLDPTRLFGIGEMPAAVDAEPAAAVIG